MMSRGLLAAVVIAIAAFACNNAHAARVVDRTAGEQSSIGTRLWLNHTICTYQTAHVFFMLRI
jgi:hypothetical protein